MSDARLEFLREIAKELRIANDLKLYELEKRYPQTTDFPHPAQMIIRRERKEGQR